MTLTITDRDVDGVAVMTLDGKVVLGDESTALRSKVKSLLDAEKKKLVLNLNGVTFVDSAGLGALVSLHNAVRSSGGMMRLCDLGVRLRTMLEMTKLISILNVSGTEQEAIESFAE